MKILITGATGGLGNAVIKFLHQEGNHNLVALVRNPEAENAQKLSHLGIEIRQGDYNDKASLVKAFTDIEVLYFVSGNDIATRLQQHQNVVEASSESGIKHIVYTSAGRKNETKNAPLFPVMRTHIDTENWIKESGINYTILQHNLYAEVVPMFLGEKEQLLESKVVYLPTGEGKTAFVSREDLAEAGVKILNTTENHINKTYAFNGNELVAFEEIATILSQIFDEPINYISPSIQEFETTMQSVGLPNEIIGMLVGFSLGISQGEFEDTKNDLEVILERKPTNLATFLQQVYS